jgi:hypothetical protein
LEVDVDVTVAVDSGGCGKGWAGEGAEGVEGAEGAEGAGRPPLPGTVAEGVDPRGPGSVGGKDFEAGAVVVPPGVKGEGRGAGRT